MVGASPAPTHAPTHAPAPLPSRASPLTVAARYDPAMRREIAAELRLLRSLLGLTQDKFGRVLDVQAVTISRWELARRHIGRVGRAKLRLLLRHPRVQRRLRGYTANLRELHRLLLSSEEPLEGLEPVSFSSHESTDA